MLSSKVNPKKYIYIATWKFKTDKKLESMRAGGRRKGRSGVEENLREWDSQDGGRTDMRARKEIP